MESNGSSYGSTEITEKHDVQLVADSDDPSRLEHKIVASNEFNNKLSGKAWGRIKKIITMKTRFPSSIYYIIGNECCERFSFYGMKAILILYLTKYLLMKPNTATSIFHVFNMLCYFTPLIGALIADSFLGKYNAGPMIGLLLISTGTGGIKPCVAAFGGDQFSKGEEKLVQSFFSVFYFAVNAGSLLSTLLTPVLRADVKCFGGDCYMLAFGVPAILMIIALLYQCLSIIIFLFLSQYSIRQYWVLRRSNTPTHPHWLDAGLDKYDAVFVEDIKCLLRLLVMFLPVPLFWALFDQQGSRWTLQAEMMDGSLGHLGTLKPDQMQAINPILIILLIPLFETVIYPLLDRCHIPNRPLQRMVTGMTFATSAFLMAGFVQLHLNRIAEPQISPDQSGLSIVNVASCEVSVESIYFTGDLQYLQSSNLTKNNPGNFSVNYSESCTSDNMTKIDIQLNKGQASRLLFYEQDTKIHAVQALEQSEKPPKYMTSVSFFSMLPNSYSSRIKLKSEDSEFILNNTQMFVTPFMNIDPGEYTIYNQGKNKSEWVKTQHILELLTGATYTVVIVPHGRKHKFDIKIFHGLIEHTVSMLLQIPQYLLITIGEVMFSVTGLTFAYSEAPVSMKSVVQAAWLLTVAVGNLIVVFVAQTSLIENQASEFFLFSALMAADVILYSIISMFYRYNNNLPSPYISGVDDKLTLVQTPIDDSIGE
ncbi:peptide transporter family 2 [Octopus bimaculoides]|nr:peptide transporter family 2 [Octopus bimaculoides]